MTHPKKKKIDDLQVLLIQTRTDDMKYHEQECFQEVTGMDSDQFRILDVWSGEVIDETWLDGVNAVIIGGSGAFLLSNPNENLPWLDDLQRFMRILVDRDIPTFASCFGFHLLALTFGGKVENVNMETGTFEILTNGNASKDPLFSNLPRAFYSIEGHNDSVTVLPDNFIHLAETSTNKFQAYKIKGKRIYATQFHPELDRSDLRTRLEYYREHYHEDDEVIEKIYNKSHETPESGRLLQLFLQKIVLA